MDAQDFRRIALSLPGAQESGDLEYSNVGMFAESAAREQR
jgi:hypothetical protein